ncbi:hypothetical protein OK351_02595 [Glutamicibacter sp. MNS18]|uniref:hypothetical protein n=1 Tax=Glutamicibacter sp. MNS18 TaxID=2989817 RepID=UPI002236C067|nr:hypothetical protein [Glutamicibacter sp. MNS18]MCW4464400.1 hypothetical protein [Glutamicibacter sp. MNS18]
MRWETLFADLEAQLEARLAGELREEIAESTRVEQARQTLDERLTGYRGLPVSLRLCGSAEVSGVVGPVGSDYLCLEDSSNRWLIRRAAVQSLILPTRRGGHPAVLVRTKFAAVIRALLRDRTPVGVYGMDGRSLGEGTLQQAAEDFLVLGVHPRDEYARGRSIQAQVLIPYSAVAWIVTQAIE